MAAIEDFVGGLERGIGGVVKRYLVGSIEGDAIVVKWEGGRGVLSLDQRRLYSIEELGGDDERPFVVHVLHLGKLQEATLEEQRQIDTSYETFLPRALTLKHPSLPTGVVSFDGPSDERDDATAKLVSFLTP